MSALPVGSARLSGARLCLMSLSHIRSVVLKPAVPVLGSAVSPAVGHPAGLLSSSLPLEDSRNISYIRAFSVACASLASVHPLPLPV